MSKRAPTAFIRAGWIAFLRAHGVLVDAVDGLSAAVQASGVERAVGDRLEITLGGQVTTPVSWPRGSWYAAEGQTSLPQKHATILYEDDPDGSWVCIALSREFDANPAHVRAFLDSGGVVVNALDAELGNRIEAGLRDTGTVVCGVILAVLPESRLVLRQSGRAYWYAPHSRREVTHGHVSLVVVPRQQATAELLEEISRESAELLLQATRLEERRSRRVIAMASQLLLSVDATPLISNERFVLYFQALEALLSLADQSPDPDMSRGLADVEILLRRHAGLDTPRLLQTLQRVRETAVKPSLKQRFARVARALNGVDAEVLVNRFAELTRLRNDLVHGRLSSVPEKYRDFVVEAELRSVCTLLLKEFVARERGLTGAVVGKPPLVV